jgi:hypothetical protein
MVIAAKAYSCIFYSIALVYMSAFVPVPYCSVAIALQYSVKSGVGMSPALVFSLRIALVIWDLFRFPFEF